MSTSADERASGAALDRPYGEIFDRGYQHYEGPRAGRAGAIRALVVYSLKRGLGIRKRWTAKIIPFVLYAAAFLPVLISVGIRALFGFTQAAIGYASLYQSLGVVLLLFAAVTAPEMLCDDRRERVLQLYFSRALTRLDYLLAKIGALTLLMATIAFVPAFILFLGNAFLAASPLRYLVDHLGDLARIAAAGALISVFYAAIGLVIAAYADRKGIAAAIYIGVVLVGQALASALYYAISAEWGRLFVLLNPGLIPEGISHWLFGGATPGGLAGPSFLISVVAAAVACALVMHRRYLLEEQV